jgi:hypothetical protein
MHGDQLLLNVMSIRQLNWCATHLTYAVRRLRTNDGPWRGRDNNLPLSFYVSQGGRLLFHYTWAGDCAASYRVRGTHAVANMAKNRRAIREVRIRSPLLFEGA